jgi:hypothetical protein
MAADKRRFMPTRGVRLPIVDSVTVRSLGISNAGCEGRTPRPTWSVLRNLVPPQFFGYGFASQGWIARGVPGVCCTDR